VDCQSASRPQQPIGLPADRSKYASVTMTHVTYHIVEHDGGWAYKVGDVFSESFPTHAQALEAARMAAREQRVPGHTEVIEWEDANGKWHTETASGSDRPETTVEDNPG